MDRNMRGISRCWQNNGWHVYSAGPCMDTYEAAIRYRTHLDRRGITWKPQETPFSAIPLKESNENL